MNKPKIKDLYCPNQECSHFGLKERGNIVGFGKYPSKHGRRRRYLCTTCNSTFSERAQTIFHGLHTDEKTILRALTTLVECGSLRAVSRIFEVKLDTVRHWLQRAAQHGELVSELLIKDIHLKQVKVDEL